MRNPLRRYYGRTTCGTAFPDLLECRNHARKSVANIWLSRPQRRVRRAALLPPAEELLANAVVLPPYSASGEAVGISAGLARLFGSSPPALQAILTLSAWKDEEALRAFVQNSPHLRLMAAFAPHMDETKFVRWTVKGSQLPLRWDDALLRFFGSTR